MIYFFNIVCADIFCWCKYFRFMGPQICSGLLMIFWNFKLSEINPFVGLVCNFLQYLMCPELVTCGNFGRLQNKNKNVGNRCKTIKSGFVTISQYFVQKSREEKLCKTGRLHISFNFVPKGNMNPNYPPLWYYLMNWWIRTFCLSMDWWIHIWFAWVIHNFPLG